MRLARSAQLASCAAALIAVLFVACAPLGVTGDGTSVSGGQPNRGWLLDGRRLADEGEGFVTPLQWKTRGLRYATDELIALLTGAARQAAAANAPVRLAVADMSFDGGGPAYAHHRSHQNGRDADLLLYMLDERGRPYQSAVMTPVGEDGLATDGSRHRLDVPRTWQLVRALVTSPERNVQYLFLDEPLIQLLLDHARATDEPPWLLDLARQTLLEPTGAPHPDHLHVRIYCAPGDLDIGCLELGNLSLLAKRPSKPAAAADTAALERLAALSPWRTFVAQLLRRFPTVSALVGSEPLSHRLPSAP